MGRLNRMHAVIATIMVAVCGVIFLIYQRTPPYTFDPTCTYDLTYRLDVTIEVAGKAIFLRRRSPIIPFAAVDSVYELRRLPANLWDRRFISSRG